MKYSLITPLAYRAQSNPGCHFITAGIKHWLRQQDPAAMFTVIEMLRDDPEGWDLAERQADKIVFCGNPRFNAVNDKVYWDWHIWKRIVHAMDKGILFIDAWAGSACPFGHYASPEDIAHRLLQVPKNAAVLKHEARAELVIARDRATEILLKTVNPRTQLLPCSTFHARLEYKVEPGPKEYNAIVLRRMPGHEWILNKVKPLQQRLHPCALVVHSYQDWLWAKALNPLCLSDPVELLRLYAKVNQLHSFRLHATIPAFSLGATVTDYEIDSRSHTLAPFAIKSVPFTQFGQ